MRIVTTGGKSAGEATERAPAWSGIKVHNEARRTSDWEAALADRDAAVIRRTTPLPCCPRFPTTTRHCGSSTGRHRSGRFEATVAGCLSCLATCRSDALSTQALAAVDYQLPGGLSWSELTTVVGASLANPSVIGWDITIYNPDLEPHERSASRIVEFIVDAHLPHGPRRRSS
jgi:hypothetical protein